MFLLVPAYPDSPGSKAVKQLCVIFYIVYFTKLSISQFIVICQFAGL